MENDKCSVAYWLGVAATLYVGWLVLGWVSAAKDTVGHAALDTLGY